MQTPPVARLALKLRQIQRGGNWRIAATLAKVLDADGKPNPGLAYRIGQHREMPNQEILNRLISDGAIPKPEPEGVRLTERDRRGLINALTQKKPLPEPTPAMEREFSKWLNRRNMTT